MKNKKENFENQSEIKKLNRQIEKLQEELDKYKKELEKLRNEKSAMYKQHSENHKQLKEVSDRLAKSENKLKDLQGLEEKNLSLIQEKSILEKNIRELENSQIIPKNPKQEAFDFLQASNFSLQNELQTLRAQNMALLASFLPDPNTHMSSDGSQSGTWANKISYENKLTLQRAKKPLVLKPGQDFVPTEERENSLLLKPIQTFEEWLKSKEKQEQSVSNRK